MDDIRRFREDGYATAFEQVYHGDGSIASAITGPNGRPIAAINIAASLARYSREDIVSRFSPYVIAASRTISKAWIITAAAVVTPDDSPLCRSF